MQFNAQFLIAVAVAVDSLFFLPRAAQAAGQTNEAVLEGRTYFVSLDYTLPSEIFLDRFFQEVGTSDSVVFDRFAGPGSRLDFVRRQELLGYGSIDRFNSDGAN